MLGISCVYKDVISYFLLIQVASESFFFIAWSRQSQPQDFSLWREGTFLLEGWDLQAVGELVRLCWCAGGYSVVH